MQNAMRGGGGELRNVPLTAEVVAKVDGTVLTCLTTGPE